MMTTRTGESFRSLLGRRFASAVITAFINVDGWTSKLISLDDLHDVDQVGNNLNDLLVIAASRLEFMTLGNGLGSGSDITNVGC